MSKLSKVLLILISIILVIAGSLFLIGYLRPKDAGLLIQTTPTATLFIDGVQVGKTPYETTRKPSEIVVKLVPETTTDKPLKAYETKITLSPGIKTIISREFGESDEASSGSIISFEKISGNAAEIAVISTPDEASVSIDGQVRGFAPLKISLMTQGEHQLVISKTNYKEKPFSVKTLNGYKLTVSVQLSLVSKPVSKNEPPLEVKKQMMIEILPTPNGFLRVRSAASIDSLEVARVDPGSQFLLVQEDSKSGWFEIEYQPKTATGSAKAGWVSNQYAKKLEVATSSAQKAD